MPIIHGIRLLFATKTRFRRIFASYLLNRSENAVGRIHSLQQFRPKNFYRPFKKKIGRSKKSDDQKKDKDPKVYMRNTIDSISKILRLSTWDSAQEQLQQLQIKWDSYTINQVLKTHPPMEKAWLFFNWASRLEGFKHDQFTYTTMLDIFGEAGRISSMKYVFEKMQEKGLRIDAVTYTSLLNWLSKDGDVVGAINMWEEMKANGCDPTVVSYTAFMKVLFDNNRPKEAAKVYKEMLEMGCSPNCHTYTVLIEYLAGAGKFKAALEILSKMQAAGVQPDKATCNILVQKCSRAGEISAMTHTLMYMKENSLVLRHPIYLEALQALKDAGESNDLLREVNPHLASEGFNEEASTIEAITSNSHFSTDRGIVLSLLARGNFVAIDHLLNETVYNNAHLNSELISTIIRENCAIGRPSGAFMAFKYSINMGMKLERTAYVNLIGLLVRTNSLTNLLEIVNGMVELGITPGTYLISLLIYKLGCAGMADSSAKIFYSMPGEQNTATYTALMDAYLRSGDVDKGLNLYTSMESKGIHASSGTYKVLTVGLEEAGRIQEADFYRKKRKSLRSNGHYRDIVSTDERLCNFLFDRSQAT
ncbi:pentatricopeptide repeat-containing protein [Cinnamomum micranthum f. kanehirae]|uniref:Pentatricopeptide repeat-containing protein n=1 Tax=Cinnamomum micranthum f. kanehirae TaxID=337451 RepID=A0A3S3MD88_9MAGN|nr:pentatricopeptide repeat-containing protein [Cinnamomum micranthum f. kanehirae]